MLGANHLSQILRPGEQGFHRRVAGAPKTNDTDSGKSLTRHNRVGTMSGAQHGVADGLG